MIHSLSPYRHHRGLPMWENLDAVTNREPVARHPRDLFGPKTLRVAVVVGTRPEAIKMAPVIRTLKARPHQFEPIVVSTGQHREMLDQVFALFDLTPDIDLGLMKPNQSLNDFSARAFAALSQTWAELKPDVVLVQGDTATVTIAGLSAFYAGIQVGHIEAGLRSFDRYNPFPEEVNRKVASAVADYHFAPTAQAADNLRAERVDADEIYLTGNTIVDALQTVDLSAGFRSPGLEGKDFTGKQMIFVTSHRRENHGTPLRNICRAIRRIIRQSPHAEVVYPVHLNPNVRSVVEHELRLCERVHLIDPVPYDDLLRLLDQSTLILTDSGGIQEEAPSFNTPLLILRETTERPEVVECGAGKLVGTDTDRIVQESLRLLHDTAYYHSMQEVENPFGDGQAARRIADTLHECYSMQEAKRTRKTPAAVPAALLSGLSRAS
ncbi:MAG: UDP-N-acetylglucosamine 2-epimerase (non-hydrolyzing) [Bacteroidota bacterium]